MTFDQAVEDLNESLERIAIALERLNDQVDTALEAKGWIQPGR